MKTQTPLVSCSTIWSRLNKQKSLRAVAVAVLALAGTALPTNVWAGTFADSFSAGLNTNYWTIAQSTPGLYTANFSPGGLTFAKTATPTSSANIVASLNLASLGGNISNDFSAQVTFTNAVLPGPNVDVATLYMSFQDGTPFDLERVGPFASYSLESILCVYNGIANQGVIYTTATAGTLTVSRTGSTVSFYFNGTFIYSQTESSPLVVLGIQLNNVSGDDTTAVTYDSFSITGPSVLNSPLRLVTPPVSQAVNVGTTATFTVAVTGLTPLAYQWQFNNTNIVWGTNSTLTITNVEPVNTGAYDVIVSNSSGSITSAPPANLVLNVLAIQMVPGLTILGSVGANTQVEWSPDLNTWNTLTNFTLPSSPFYYADWSAVGQPKRFYRAVFP